jgi:DNA polymerase III alpha subunit/intein/homing endonuclease
MNEKDFVHLHSHTDFSLLDGAIKIKPLAKRAQEIGARAVAITDHGNMFGALSFYNTMKGSGIKPIIGIEAYLSKSRMTDRGETTTGERGRNHIILLAKNLQGYQNLIKLTSFSYTEGFYYKPCIDKEFLSQHAEGLVCLSACLSGVPSSLLLTDKFDEAARRALEFEDMFGKGNYYLEVQNHQLEEEVGTVIPGMRELSKKTGIPLVATNDCHYLMKEDWRAHDIHVCIGAGKVHTETRRVKYQPEQFFFRTPQEMWMLFGKDMPEALLNTVAIAEMCELELPFGQNHLPAYRVPDGYTTDSYFAKVAQDGLEERWEAIKNKSDRKFDYDDYRARLEREIQVITNMGFPGYFLIVWDFIKYARTSSIPVGPGRGCLEGNVPIVLEDGTTTPISQIKIGDKVRSHTGRALEVSYLHRYPVNETLVRLKCFYGESSGVTLTRDHKILAERGVRPERWLRQLGGSTREATRQWEEPAGKLDWLAAGELKPGDWVFVPTPKVDVTPLGIIDLADTCDASLVTINEHYIAEPRPTNKPFTYSLHDVHRLTGVSRNSLRFIAQNHTPIKTSPRHDKALARVRDYIEPQFGDLESWRCWVNEQAHTTTRIARFINPDSRFYRLLGRWIADGWLRSDSDLVFGLCFHSDDQAGIDEAVNYLASIGLEAHLRRAANGRKLTQLVVRSRALVAYWRSIFPGYQSTPQTKHLPDFVLALPVENVLDVLAGYWSGDGSVGNSQQSKFTATTVSRTLADQVRFLAWRCSIPASLRKEVRHDERFHTQPSYTITIAKDERLAAKLGARAKAEQYVWRAVEDGILLRLREIEEVQGVKEVFDLTVEEDHTYQTSSFAVHNSAAGSLVAYTMRITDIDPLQYELLFERFLNPERVSMPDIDIDFCVHGRQKVIDYVADYYGRDHVSQIATFGTMASKAAIKDVGRALDVPYADVEKIAKMIPPPVRGRNVSISQAMQDVPELKKAIETDPRIKELIEIALRLEGCSRHTSVHAAGVVISPRPLYELVPISKTSRDEITTQYPMNDLEKTGMLKMDFLALTTLTIIEDCLKSISRETGAIVDLANIPLDDKASLQIFCDGKCDAIFQFESDGMKDLCRRLKPEGLEDLSALNALYRPGPIDSGMVDDFIDRRHGKKKIRYDFPELKDVLGNTMGVIVYQEQIMAVFQRLAGYSLGEADLVRRAMGKKKREELDKHKEKFTKQAMERGHEKEKLDKLWQSMEGFADYAFNRAHSFAYGYLAYQTAYLKAYYPTHFLAAVLSNELNNTAKVVKYISEARSQGIEILPPDVNASFDNFTANANTIRFGLAAIKGIGQAAVSCIVDARNSGGGFKSIFDFTERVDAKAVNKRVLESLVKSGAFDSTAGTHHRAQLFAAIDSAIESGQRSQKSKASGQVSLFGAMIESMQVAEPPLPNAEQWSKQELLKGEKETLGFYISGHPLQGYEAAMKDIANADVDSLLSNYHHGAQVCLGGIIIEMSVRTTKKGDRFALMQIEDQYGSVKIVVWPETYRKSTSVLQESAPVLVRGRLEIDDGGAASIIADEIQSLVNLRERAAKLMSMRFPIEAVKNDRLDRLYELLDNHRGDCEIIFEVELEGGHLARIQPNQFVKVRVTPELTNSITELMGERCRVELRVGKASSAAR